MPIIDTDKGPIEFPDSMSTAQIEAALQSMHAPNESPEGQGETSFGRPMSLMRSIPNLVGGALDTVPGTLGALGGVGGFLMGGPGGALVGAGALGTAGAKLRRMGRESVGLDSPQPWSIGREAEDYKQGRDQATLEGAGLLTAGVAPAITARFLKPRAARMAPEVMHGALRGVPRLGRLMAESRTLVPDAVREGVPISEGGSFKGTSEMSVRRQAAHAAEDAAASESRGHERWSPSTLVDEVEQSIRDAAPRNKRLTIVDSPEWLQARNRFIEEYSDEVPAGRWNQPHPQEPQAGAERPFDSGSMLVAKRNLDQKAFDAHMRRTQSKTQSVKLAADDIQEAFDKGVADLMRKKLRESVPNLGRLMQHSKELMALERAYQGAETRPPGALMGEGGIVKNVVKKQINASPAKASRRAISMDRYSRAPLKAPGMKSLATRQLPRLSAPYLFPYENNDK